MSIYTKSQKLDAKKLVKLINNGYVSQFNEASNCIKEAGKKVGRSWNLITINGPDIIFEDVNSKQFLMARYKSKPKLELTGITPIQVVDENKEGELTKACLLLVESIESGNKTKINSAFNRMALCKFSNKVIPSSGKIKCKDGKTYSIAIEESNRSLNDLEISKIAKHCKDHYNTSVIIDEGKITAVSTGGEKIKINPIVRPLSKARSLRDVAIGGHTNNKMVSTTFNSASLLAEGKEVEAAKEMGKFFSEYEEFTLLNEGQMNNVISNCLATRAVFNPELVDDLSTIAHKINLKLNQKTIIREWKAAAKKSGCVPLLENISKLEKSNDFEVSHRKLMEIIFEDAGGRDTKILMLRTTLEKMSNDIPGIARDPDLNEKMRSLIGRLKSGQVDEATIYEAEDVVAAVGDELQDTETLEDFDNVGSDEDDEFDFSSLDDDAAEAVDSNIGGDKEGVTLEINSPLIQIGGTSAAGQGEDDLESGLDDFESDEVALDDVDLDDMDDDSDEDLGDDSDEDPLDAGDDDDFDFGSLDDDEDEDEAFESVSSNVRESLSNYGKNLLRNAGVIGEIVESMQMQSIAGSKNPKEMAKKAINGCKIKHSPGMTSELVREAVQAFESADVPDFIKDKMSDNDEEDCDEDDIEKVEEEQLQGPTRTFRGMKNSDHKDHFIKGKIASESDTEELEDDEEKVEEEQIKGPRRDPRGIKNSDHKDHPIGESVIKWNSIDNDSSQGILDNVKFVLGHKSHDNMLIKSQDGAVTVPVPVKLCESALASLKLIDSDPKPFVKWVDQIVESIRPMTESDEDDLDDEVDNYAIDQLDDESDESDDMSSVYDGGQDDNSDASTEEYELNMVGAKSGEQIPVQFNPDGTLSSIGGVDTSNDNPDDDLEDLGSDDTEDDDNSPNFGSDDSDSDDGGDADADDDDDDDADTDDDTADSDEDDSDDDSDDDEDEELEEETVEESEEVVTEDLEDSTLEIGLYWYGDSWHVADGLLSKVDQPAPESIQNFADKIGINKKILNGEIDPDQLIFNLVFDLGVSGEVSPGDVTTPDTDDRQSVINSAVANLSLPNGETKSINIDQNTLNELNVDLGEDITGSMS